MLFVVSAANDTAQAVPCRCSRLGAARLTAKTADAKTRKQIAKLVEGAGWALNQPASAVPICS
jgi:hypothetical protein